MFKIFNYLIFFYYLFIDFQRTKDQIKFTKTFLGNRSKLRYDFLEKKVFYWHQTRASVFYIPNPFLNTQNYILEYIIVKKLILHNDHSVYYFKFLSSTFSFSSWKYFSIPNFNKLKRRKTFCLTLNLQISVVDVTHELYIWK